MSLQIIGAGYGRTGTTSTKIALQILGYPCYHMSELLQNTSNKEHLDFWNRVANQSKGQQHNWSEVFSNYKATVDNPGCAVWQELYESYPNAKVILTIHPRGPSAWYDSAMDTIYSGEVLWQYKLLRILFPRHRKFGNMASKLIWKRLHRETMKDKSAAIIQYKKHIEEVKSIVPSDRLLIFSADQGWGPLCEFLSVAVPDREFPKVNERAEMKRKIRAQIRWGYFLVIVIFLALAGMIWVLLGTIL